MPWSLQPKCQNSVTRANRPQTQPSWVRVSAGSSNPALACVFYSLTCLYLHSYIKSGHARTKKTYAVVHTCACNFCFLNFYIFTLFCNHAQLLDFSCQPATDNIFNRFKFFMDSITSHLILWIKR